MSCHQATKAELKAAEEKKKKDAADKKEQDKRTAASSKVPVTLFMNGFCVI